MRKTHTWGEEYAKGLQGELWLDRYLAQRYLVTQATREQQRKGVDRMVTRLSDWVTVAVEYKTDYRAKDTGNAYIETVSVEDHDQSIPGWAYKSEADVLLYYVHPVTLYILRLKTLRAVMGDWLKRYRTVSAYNRRYRGQGILVPLQELSRVAHKTIKFN